MTESAEQTPKEPYKIVFVATYPDKEGRSPKFLDELLAAGYKILHPAYNYNSNEGVDMATYLKLNHKLDVPTDKNPWKALQLRDYFGIRNSSMVIYDLDRDPGAHFLAIACLFQKPVIGVSETMCGVPAYFSGSVSVILKPEDLLRYLPA